MGHDVHEQQIGAPASDIWTISCSKDGTTNPYIGDALTVTWLKPWGGKPAGYRISGILKDTFCVNGRTLIGELLINDGKKVITCPWSRNYLFVEFY